MNRLSRRLHGSLKTCKGFLSSFGGISRCLGCSLELRGKPMEARQFCVVDVGHFRGRICLWGVWHLRKHCDVSLSQVGEGRMKSAVCAVVVPEG